MNLVFDGNYLGHKVYGVFHKYVETENKREMSKTEVLSDKENQGRFFRKLITDFCSTVRSLDEIQPVEDVVFVFDDISWRKSFYYGYKNREPENDVERLKKDGNRLGEDLFHQILTKFEKHLSRRGFITTRGYNLEGDDWCYFWSKHYNSQNKRCVIITGDKDILQTLSLTVSVYRNNSMCPAMFIHKESKFFLGVGKRLSEKITKLKIEPVDPVKHLFKKILTGDDGDGVPNLFKGMGDKTAEKIFQKAEEFGITDCRYSDQEYRECVGVLVKDTVKKSPELEDIVESIKLNAKLMWLDESVYTQEQVEGSFSEISRKQPLFSYKGGYNLSEILEELK